MWLLVRMVLCLSLVIALLPVTSSQQETSASQVGAIDALSAASPEQATSLDDWREKQTDRPGRPEAIRRLIAQALAIAAPSAPAKAGSRRKAAELAGRAIDALGDQAATVEERAHRKSRLIKGPREFRDVRGDQPKKKGSIAMTEHKFKIGQPQKDRKGVNRSHIGAVSDHQTTAVRKRRTSV